MLQTMRELTKSWIFKGLMLLLVVSFAIWGIGDMFRGNPSQRSVASVGSIDIPVHQLETRFMLELPQARQVFGPEMTVTQARQMGVLDRALAMMMEELTFDQEAARLNVFISHDQILSRVAAEPRFRDKDGKFNADLWQRTLRQLGMTEQSFFDLEAKNMARQMIFSSVTANKTMPQIMIDTLYQARGAKRLVEVLTLRNDSVRGIVTPSDAELEAYYKEHENEFIAPEYRGLTIAHLAVNTLSKDIVVTDDEVKAAYKDRAAEMVLPETRDLIQIVLQDEAKAKTVADAAQPSRNLSQAAKANGLTPIAMNNIDEKMILPDLYATVFALEEGQVSGPIKSSLGWHVVQVKKINAGGQQDFDKVKDKLRATIQEERVGDVIAKTVNQIDDSVASGKTIEEMADTLKLHLTRFAMIDAKGTASDGKKADNIPAQDMTLPTAFQLGAGETSQVIDDGQGNYYIVRVDQITPSQTRPFAEAKKSVQTAWLENQYYEKSKAMAEEIANALREGKPATSYATHPGMEVRLSKAITVLGDTDKDIPEVAIPEILQMKKGDVTTAASGGKQYILRLADIVAVDPKKPESSRYKILEDLKDKMPHNMIDQYAKQLHARFPTSINTALLNSLKNQAENAAQ